MPLMDFCIGTVVFVLIGFSLLMGEDLLGFIGKPGFDLFTAYESFDFSSFVFNLVFCANRVGKALEHILPFGFLIGGHVVYLRHLPGLEAHGL